MASHRGRGRRASGNQVGAGMRYHVQSPLRVMPGQQNGLRVVPCSQPDPLEPPGTTAPVRGVIVLLGVHCCFHGLECGVKKALRGADFARECEVRALVLRPQAASRRVLASHFPLGPLAHIGRLAGTPSPRLCGGDASPGCTQIAAERHIAPCAPPVASLPPPLLRTFHQMCGRGADASPAAEVLSPRILCVTRKKFFGSHCRLGTPPALLAF